MSSEQQYNYTEAELLAMTPAPAPVESPYIITIDELKATQEALSNKETVDRATLNNFIQPDVENLKKRLLNWASSGFPDGFVIFSLSIQLPNKCLDGEVRDIFNYVNYLLGEPIGQKLQVLNSKLPGMLLSYSFPGDQVCIHVSKS